MKNIFKYTFLSALIGFAACDVDNELPEITDPNASTETVALDVNGVDFSKYIAVGASFTAGFTDGALFIEAQKNSFPNILANKFKMANGGDFAQPLMSDNHGGFVSGSTVVQPPRFYFNGNGPTRISETPTTQVGAPAEGKPNFNNYGIPGAKSFHLLSDEYGNRSYLTSTPPKANPYFVRMASADNATVIGDAAAQQPTFFTLSEIGGNDVLGYALSGGTGKDQNAAGGSTDPTTYGGNDITHNAVFANTFTGIVDVLTAGGAKGVVANVPYITSLAHFTTVPHNPVPLDEATASGVNQGYAAYNQGIQQAFAYLVANTPMTQEMADAEIAKRTINFSAGANAVVMIDEDLTDLTVVNPALISIRQATSSDLIVLPASSFIGTTVGGNPQMINGVSVPLEDKWVLTPQEQEAIKNATDAYNTTIKSVADAKGLAFVDFKEILANAATTGYSFDNYTLTTSLVSGGLISLDGVHLTGRGYAVMANEILKAIDTTYGSNFSEATDGMAKADDHPTNYGSEIVD